MAPSPRGPGGDPAARDRVGERAVAAAHGARRVRPAARAAVWTGALVAALAEVGVEEKAARQALSRTAAKHLLTAERDGRRVRWHLTDAGTRLLAEGTERIYGFGREVPPWDERWLVVAVSVPESQRQLRHRLRTRLTWAGLGSPLPGLWVTPDTGKEEEVAAVVDELGVEGYSFAGPYGLVGDERRVVEAAWHSGRWRSATAPSSRCSLTLPPPGPSSIPARPSARSCASCRSGAASPSSTPACRPACCRSPGPAPQRQRCSTSGTTPGTRPPRRTGRRSATTPAGAAEVRAAARGQRPGCARRPAARPRAAHQASNACAGTGRESGTPPLRRSLSAASAVRVAPSSTPSATMLRPRLCAEVHDALHDQPLLASRGHRHGRTTWSIFSSVTGSVPELAQAGVAGPEVVDGEPDPEPGEPLEQPPGPHRLGQ